MFGIVGMMELVDDVRLGRADPAREGEELGGADVLAAQGEHVVLVERPLELGEVGVRQRLGEIDAVGLDAEAGELLEADHFRNSGEMSRGRNRMISGKKMVKREHAEHRHQHDHDILHHVHQPHLGDRAARSSGTGRRAASPARRRAR